MDNRFLHIHPKDNILVALQDIPEGTDIHHDNITIRIPKKVKAKHKFALSPIKKDALVYMYGSIVGKAVVPIKKGEAITTENLVHAASTYQIENQQWNFTPPNIDTFKDRTFMGYHRKDGSVGTANYWLVIPLVFCENRNVEVLKTALLKPLGYKTSAADIISTETLIKQYKNQATSEELLKSNILKPEIPNTDEQVFPNVDGIKFLTHDGGCGGIRQDSNTLCNLLAGYITNPNVAGATVLSLGCQNAQIPILEDAINKRDAKFSKPLVILEQQQSKSEQHFIEDAVKQTFLGLIEANKIKRAPAPLNKLTLGLECGGSDGFSGISANPALGHVSDMLVALGASTVLAEFPELNGVEQELLNRCESKENAKKFATLMQTYAKRAEELGSGFENNPSPGNIKDGLITDAMKSAGAAKKGGTSTITDVLDYTEPVKKKGLNLLCTPGNDVESTTGLAGSGCTIICFTTGLGTPTGNPIAPTIKIASNTQLSERMADIIDFNTGGIIEATATIESKGEELLEYIIAVASGEKIPNAVRLGQDDFIPWKRGISL
ncbi:UxaA family hydrolase [Maribacter dokdonensis]|uniref:UxaA family hydrolase n=1 Tax=Maribacter dokdonensis TaxID=320912 RepID=UPI0007199AB3|nr:altronate dehydratase family protein [Maribacter dokdonensis]KSA12236.1 Altronate hydrolase [Maribacter dokdonensis DSW-8]